MEVLTPADWPVLMTARLHALEDSPEAFLSSYHTEEGWGEDEWRNRFEAAVWVVARQGEEVIGLAGSGEFAHRPPWERYVESVWVHPSRRGTGVTRTLLQALVEAEPDAGIKELWLWVLDSNHEARRTYERLGFRPTGFKNRLKDGSGRTEERWVLALAEGPVLF